MSLEIRFVISVKTSGIVCSSWLCFQPGLFLLGELIKAISDVINFSLIWIWFTKPKAIIVKTSSLGGHMNKKVLVLVVTSVISVLMSACASVPMADMSADAESKKFETKTGMGRIYVYRNEVLGSAIKIPMTLNGKVMGSTAKNVYFSWDVKPGNHKVSCLASTNGNIEVNVKKNEIVYIWQEMKMGLIVAGCALNKVEAGVGQKAIRSCKLAQTNY